MPGCISWKLFEEPVQDAKLLFELWSGSFRVEQALSKLQELSNVENLDIRRSLIEMWGSLLVLPGCLNWRLFEGTLEDAKLRLDLWYGLPYVKKGLTELQKLSHKADKAIHKALVKVWKDKLLLPFGVRKKISKWIVTKSKPWMQLWSISSRADIALLELHKLGIEANTDAHKILINVWKSKDALPYWLSQKIPEEVNPPQTLLSDPSRMEIKFAELQRLSNQIDSAIHKDGSPKL